MPLLPTFIPAHTKENKKWCRWLCIRYRSLLIVGLIVVIIMLSLALFYLILYFDPTATFQENTRIFNKMVFMGGDMSHETEWVSLVGYVSSCDVAENIELSGIFDDGSSIIHNRNAFENIKNGDLVCLTGDQLTQDFLPNILPLYADTDIYFTIFTWIRPRSFPLELLISTQQFGDKILSNPHILHVYCIDYDGTKWNNTKYNSKLSGVPLGINYMNRLYKYRFGIPQHPERQESTLNQYISSTFTNYNERKLKIFRDDMNNPIIMEWKAKSKAMIDDFTESKKKTKDLWLKKDKSLEFRILRRNIARWNAYYKLNASLVYNEMQRKTEKELFMERSKYVFILSPFGGGIDCYRTWEALMFGHIVITERSPLDNLYQDLPVIVVNDWREINQNKLEFWYKKYFFNQTAQNNQNVRIKLSTRYWIKYMKEQRS